MAPAAQRPQRFINANAVLTGRWTGDGYPFRYVVLWNQGGVLDQQRPRRIAVGLRDPRVPRLGDVPHRRNGRPRHAPTAAASATAAVGRRAGRKCGPATGTPVPPADEGASRLGVVNPQFPHHPSDEGRVDEHPTSPTSRRAPSCGTAGR